MSPYRLYAFFFLFFFLKGKDFAYRMTTKLKAQTVIYNRDGWQPSLWTHSCFHRVGVDRHGPVQGGMKDGIGHVLQVLFSTSWSMTIETRGEQST